MYCQLMRDQLQQEEQRERQLQQNAALQYIQQQSMSAPAPSPAINAPQHYQSMQVPVEVLKVRYRVDVFLFSGIVHIQSTPTSEGGGRQGQGEGRKDIGGKT